MDETCATCRFWTAEIDDEPDRGIALCRRYAPSPRTRTNYEKPIYGDWPRTHDFDWCGEHEPKAPA